MNTNTLKNSKKGFTVGEILPIVMIFLTTIIAIGLGSQVLEQMQTTQDDDVVTAANNLTLTWGGNNTAMGLGEGRVSAVILYNNGSLVNQGDNYTFTGGSLTVLNSSPSGKVGSQSEWLTETLNVTYTYNIGSAARNATGQGLNSQNTFAKWLPTIALVIMIAIIIGILIVYLAGKVGGVGKYAG